MVLEMVGRRVQVCALRDRNISRPLPLGSTLVIEDLGTKSVLWVMRSSNGSLWATTMKYTTAQVKKFLLATPVKPIQGIAEDIVKPGTLNDLDRYGLSLQ